MKHKARKRFGQNFLNDPDIIARIIGAINLAVDDQVIEIGPGKAAITRPLLERLDSLDVVELDRDLIPLLAGIDQTGKLHIHQADALNFDFCQLVRTGKQARIVGNLPYNISTPLLFHLFVQHCIADMHFMLQKEVVLRLAASPGTKQYGRLSVMAQYYCEITPLFEIGPECFDPAPKVTSAFVKLTPKPLHQLTARNMNKLGQVVSMAFSQRRKTLRNALREIATVEEMEAVGINPGSRAENLAVSDFIALGNHLDD
ncbi:MAG TPA: 16S rRNA (adenine(1518)-N(6)/adenine(1519)-N(6))-dimethyltransferase RsmA [Gammaproteobacteria bacterium]|nr:16S rRNA (adenine(1518)-N(6)/adenine(1519)-N(6))-dimethyltransferase RsmA [Gammaproteobacteria bacterium]